MDSIKKAVVGETVVVSIANAILGGVGTFFALPKGDVLPLLGGPESAGFALVPPSIGFPLIGILLTTHLIGKKVAENKIDASSSQAVNWLPKNTLLAAIVFTLISVFVFVPAALGLTWLLLGDNVSYLQAMIVAVIYLIALSILVIPPVVRRAIHLASDRALNQPAEA